MACTQLPAKAANALLYPRTFNLQLEIEKAEVEQLLIREAPQPSVHGLHFKPWKARVYLRRLEKSVQSYV